MSDTFVDLLSRLRASQEESVARQQQVSSAVNASLAGGLEGIAGVADALDTLRSVGRQAPAYPSPPSENPIAQVLASVARAQLDATNRNAHVADAVTTGVLAGTDGLAAAAEALKMLAQPEQFRQETYRERIQAAVEQARRPTSRGDEPATGPGDELSTSPGDSGLLAARCPTCAGTGHVYVRP